MPARRTVAIDPNEKLSAGGFRPEACIPADTLIRYRINFENEASATAPAQRVEVTDQLSANVDWNTLQFTEFRFGDTLVTVPSGRPNYFDTESMTYNNQTFDVQVELAFDSTTGVVIAVFQSLDPGTSLPPDVLTGFLPPEDGTGIGQAFFSYTVQPMAGLASGTELRNIALIRFDGQTIIATNQIDPHDPSKGTDLSREAHNTIDAASPISAVVALPAQNNSSFAVHWSGADETGGSGLAAYHVLVSDNGGPYTLWQTASTETSALFTGQPGHTYRFYTQSADNVGHLELAPASADASTQIGTRIWHNFINSLDVTGAAGQADGLIVAGDALAIINYINASGAGHIPANASFGPPYLDTTGPGDTGDDFVVAADALAVINFINAFGAGLPGPAGEGENPARTSKATSEPEIDGGALQSASNVTAAALLAALLADVVHAQAANTGASQPPVVLVATNSAPLSSRFTLHEISLPALSRPTLRVRLSNSSTDSLDEFFTRLASKPAGHLRHATGDGYRQ